MRKKNRYQTVRICNEKCSIYIDWQYMHCCYNYDNFPLPCFIAWGYAWFFQSTRNQHCLSARPPDHWGLINRAAVLKSHESLTAKITPPQPQPWLKIGFDLFMTWPQTQLWSNSSTWSRGIPVFECGGFPFESQSMALFQRPKKTGPVAFSFPWWHWSRCWFTCFIPWSLSRRRWQFPVIGYNLSNIYIYIYEYAPYYMCACYVMYIEHKYNITSLSLSYICIYTHTFFWCVYLGCWKPCCCFFCLKHACCSCLLLRSQTSPQRSIHFGDLRHGV